MFLTSFQVILILLVQGPIFRDHCYKRTQFTNNLKVQHTGGVGAGLCRPGSYKMLQMSVQIIGWISLASWVPRDTLCVQQGLREGLPFRSLLWGYGTANCQGCCLYHLEVSASSFNTGPAICQALLTEQCLPAQGG